MASSTSIENNAYAVRLTDLGETRDVIASEDIYNEQGALLVKKGSKINKKLQNTIIKFRLLKPIESSIDIANSLGPMEIHRDINQMLSEYPAILALHLNSGLEKTIKQLCLELGKYPLLRQKLTVMQQQMPQLYRQTISVTWLSIAITSQMQLPEARVTECFLASLAHDIGMMHIDPSVLDKEEALTPAEWRQVQAHTVIGQRLLENIPNMNKRVARIVVEHHERCDGTGYPAGKFENKLTQESQIIAFSDSVVSVYIKKFKHKGGNLRDLYPFILVNSESHFYSTYTALITVLRPIKQEMEITSHINNDNVVQEINSLMEKNDRLSSFLSSIVSLIESLDLNEARKPIQSANAILLQVLKTVKGSGVLDNGYLRWLEQVKTDKLDFAYREAADVYFMMEEIEWHLKRLIRILETFVDQAPESDSTIKNAIKEKLHHCPFSALHQPEQHERQEEYAISAS